MNKIFKIYSNAIKKIFVNQIIYMKNLRKNKKKISISKMIYYSNKKICKQYRRKRIFDLINDKVNIFY